MRNRFLNRRKRRRNRHHGSEDQKDSRFECRHRVGDRCRLTDLEDRQGQRCRVLYIADNCRFKRRLHQMGIVGDTEIEIVRRAPLRDPIEIKVGDFHVGLRREEAKDIVVEMIN